MNRTVQSTKHEFPEERLAGIQQNRAKIKREDSFST